MGKSNFNKMMDRFYEDGLMKKVYQTDNALVCNILDQFYIAFSTEVLSRYEDKGMFPGFIMSTVGLQEIVKDDTFATRYYGLLGPEEQKTALRFVDETFHSTLMRTRDAFKKLGPPENMDLAYEQQLIASQSKQGELATMLEEVQAQSLTAAQQKGVPIQK